MRYKYKIGDVIVRRNDGDSFEYLAKIKDIKSGEYKLVFDDGSKGWHGASHIEASTRLASKLERALL